MGLMSDSFRSEVLSRTWEVFETLIGLEKVKMMSSRKVGCLVLLEPTDNQFRLYVETLSVAFGQLADFIKEKGDLECLRTLAKRNGWILTYHQDLVSSWQKREPVVWSGGAVKLQDGLVISFKSSGTSEDSAQEELNDEALVLCAAQGLALAEETEVKTIAKISQNNTFDELWAAFWH